MRSRCFVHNGTNTRRGLGFSDYDRYKPNASSNLRSGTTLQPFTVDFLLGSCYTRAPISSGK